MHETTLPVNDFWYANHIEAVFITHGGGELTDQETGNSYQLRPASAYLLDEHEHEHHQLRTTTKMRPVCSLTPAHGPGGSRRRRVPALVTDI